MFGLMFKSTHNRIVRELKAQIPSASVDLTIRPGKKPEEWRPIVTRDGKVVFRSLAVRYKTAADAEHAMRCIMRVGSVTVEKPKT